MSDSLNDRLVQIPSHPDYAVDPARQQVYRVRPGRQPRPIKARPDGKGYLSVSLRRDGGTTEARLHRLIWEAANGRRVPDGMMILHRDDDRLFNHPSNLYVGTAADNRRDAIRNGRIGPRLTRTLALRIKIMGQLGGTARLIATVIGRPITTVQGVLAGRTWRSVNPSWSDYAAALAAAQLGG